VVSSRGLARVSGRHVTHTRVSVQKCRTRVKAAEGEQGDKMKALQDAMNNPELLKAVEERMQQPEVQQEMQAMNAMMSNPEFMARAAELREDPDLKPMFEEIRTGGMAAMMKYMNDPVFLTKIGEKLGDLPIDQAAAPAAPPPAAAPAAPAPEINSILDAARYGDLEAIEDFVAIGKGEFKDDQGRTALHYAVAYDQGAAAGALIENGVDVNAQDNMGNTALHFAAGYGRGSAVKALLTVGVNPSTKNNEGKTAKDLITDQPNNPLNNITEILNQL
jgi:hypothetical protein